MNRKPPTTKMSVPCSECGAIILVGSTLGASKMLCPKCLTVITLPESTSRPPAKPISEKSVEVEMPGKSTAERPDTRRMEARLSTLDVRVALLEQEVGLLKLARRVAQEAQARAPRTASHPVAAPTASNAAPPEPQAESAFPAPAPPIPPAPATPAETEPAPPSPEPETRRISIEEARPADGTPIGEAVEKQMAGILAECRAGEIAIRVREGNIEAIGFGEWLQRVFVAGGWRVNELEAIAMPSEKEDVTLCISGGSVFPKSASTIQRALLAAGVGLSFALDPTSKSPVPVLIAPKWPREERPRD